MDLLKLLFSYEGRIGRGQFWLAVAIYVGFLLVVIGLAASTGSMTAMFGAGLIAYIPVIISSIFAGIKRLHDRDKSGWWLVVFYVLPFVLPFLAPVFGGDGDADETPTIVTVLQYIGFAISLWALVELGFIRGTIGGNPYGPDPVAPKPAKH